MGKILKSLGGVLFGIATMMCLFHLPTVAQAAGGGAIAAVTGGIGNTIDPCLNNGGAFGFVFCPAVDTFAGVIDYFLDTMQAGFNWSYLVDTGADSLDVISVWSSLLPVANVFFAIVFIMVIYSVATGQGLNNYSIKKIMPRLILVAVAVNVSYYICAALIDISNIIGTSIYDLVYSTLAGSNIGISFVSLADSVFSNSSAGGNLVGSTGSIGALLILFVNMAAVLIGVGAVFVSIAARNVILMMLLLSAPLAFVTALLPNTEDIFRKWSNNFLRLLVIYPAFMLIWAICRALQVVFLDADASTLDLILSMLLSVAPAITIVPLFRASGGLTGKIANVVQRGSAGLSSASIAGSQTVNKRLNSQNIDQINQKKFTNNQSMTTNANNRRGDTQNNFSNETDPSLTSRTTQAVSEINRAPAATKTGTGRSKRSRALSTSVKSKVDISTMQSPLRQMRNSSLTTNVNQTSNTSRQTNNSSRHTNTSSRQSQTNTSSRQAANTFLANQQANTSLRQSSSSLNTASSQTNTANNTTINRALQPDLGGEFTKLADAVREKTGAQQLTRERASASEKKPTPTPRMQTFAESSAKDQKSAGKADQAFDISTKSPVNNIFSGQGQQVSVENSGGTSQLIENQILDNPVAINDAPSILPTDDSAEDALSGSEVNQLSEEVRAANSAEPGDEVVAAAPSIVEGVVTDDDRRQRFADEAGQKALAAMLTITNIRQFLPSDIDYILGLAPLLSRQGEQLADKHDISDQPEYKAAAAVITDYISTLSDTEKQAPDVLKWQKKLGLL